VKKLLLVAVSGFAGVAALRSDAQTMTTVLVPRTEGLSFGFPNGYKGSPRYLNYYPYGYSGHPYVHYYPHAGKSVLILLQSTGTADIGLTTGSLGIMITAAGSPDQRC
jgi:hypothetical protein